MRNFQNKQPEAHSLTLVHNNCTFPQRNLILKLFEVRYKIIQSTDYFSENKLTAIKLENKLFFSKKKKDLELLFPFTIRSYNS